MPIVLPNPLFQFFAQKTSGTQRNIQSIQTGFMAAAAAAAVGMITERCQRRCCRATANNGFIIAAAATTTLIIYITLNGCRKITFR